MPAATLIWASLIALPGLWLCAGRSRIPRAVAVRPNPRRVLRRAGESWHGAAGGHAERGAHGGWARHRRRLRCVPRSLRPARMSGLACRHSAFGFAIRLSLSWPTLAIGRLRCLCLPHADGPCVFVAADNACWHTALPHSGGADRRSIIVAFQSAGNHRPHRSQTGHHHNH